jgi:hypothetical protein
MFMYGARLYPKLHLMLYRFVMFPTYIFRYNIQTGRPAMSLGKCIELLGPLGSLLLLLLRVAMNYKSQKLRFVSSFRAHNRKLLPVECSAFLFCTKVFFVFSPTDKGRKLFYSNIIFIIVKRNRVCSRCNGLTVGTGCQILPNVR